jgi:hypothetical protein
MMTWGDVMKRWLTGLSVGLLLVSSVCFSAASDDKNVLCRSGINSTVAVGRQLTNNPNFRSEDFYRFIDNQSLDMRLKKFLKLKIVPRLMDKNLAKLNVYITSGSAMSECVDDLSSY